MDSIIIAAATDDGKRFPDRHFGDADRYAVYKVTPEMIELVKEIPNLTEEEKVHADPAKAGSITGLLRKEGVQAVVTTVFGPNLKRIKKKFVCIIAESESIEETLNIVRERFSQVQEAWEAGEDRGIIRL